VRSNIVGRNVGKTLGKLILSIMPVLLTPVWGYLIADGYINFGGGEKDLLLLIPWIVWSLIYLVIFIVAWIKRKKTKTMVLYSVGGASGILMLAWVILFIWFNGILGAYKG
jgi:hypothetical protein